MDNFGAQLKNLRIRYGMTQAVFNPDVNADAHVLAESLRNEYVIQVTGKVEPRPEGTVNPKLSTGEIDILAQNLTILNSSDNQMPSVEYLPMRPGEPPSSVVVGAPETLEQVGVDPELLVKFEDGVIQTVDYFREYLAAKP